MKDLMLRYSCLITGDDYSMVERETPESKKKITKYGISVLIPVAVWFLNVLLLVSQVLEAPLGIAIVMAIFFSFIILLIESLIVRSSKSFGMMAFRFLLGLGIASLGAIGLEEVVFKKDIDRQMLLINAETINQSVKGVENFYDPRITKQEKEVEKARQIWLTAEQHVKEEIEGKSSGSGLKGVSTIAKEKIRVSERRRDDYTKSSTQLKELKNTRDKVIKEKENVMMGQLDQGGLLFRLKALIALVTGDLVAGIFMGIFAFVFLFMEFIVIIMKFDSNKTNWDRRQKFIEEMGKQRMTYLAQMNIVHHDPEKHIQDLMNNQKNLQLSSKTSIFN